MRKITRTIAKIAEDEAKGAVELAKTIIGNLKNTLKSLLEG